MKIVFDTSALMSLAAGNILGFTFESLQCVVPERVCEELRGLSKNDTFEWKIAQLVIDYLQQAEIVQSYKKSSEGELECAYVANEIEDAEFLITDDTAALSKLEKICTKEIRFSPIIPYALCLKGKMTKKQAIHTLEQMRIKRNWKDNIIFEQALILLEQLP